MVDEDLKLEGISEELLSILVKSIFSPIVDQVRLVTLDKVNAPTVLTTTGIQYSTAITVTGANTDNEIFKAKYDPPRGGEIMSIWFALASQIYRGATSENQTRLWQVSQNNSDWVNMFTAVVANSGTTPGTLYVDSGDFKVVPMFHRVPFWVRLLVQTPTTTNAVACVVNSSMFEVRYFPE